jgi:hypothetical protein
LESGDRRRKTELKKESRVKTIGKRLWKSGDLSKKGIKIIEKKNIRALVAKNQVQNLKIESEI